MEIIEALIFTKEIVKILSDDEYQELQCALIENPQLGRLIQGGAGLRKLRWSSAGTGKRGGLRVIYYYLTRDDQIYLMLPYRKSKQGDLTKDQLKKMINYLKEEGL